MMHFEKLDEFPAANRALGLELLNLSVCLPWDGRDGDALANESARQEMVGQLNRFLADTQFAYAFPDNLDETAVQEIDLPYDSFFVYQILQEAFASPTAFVESELFYLLRRGRHLLAIRIPTRTSPQRVIGKSGWVFESAGQMTAVAFGPPQTLNQVIGTFLKGLKRAFNKTKSQHAFRQPESVRKIMDNPFHIYMTQARSLLQTLPEDSAYASTAPFFLLWAAVEGFVNMIYELYLDEAYRHDKRILEQLKRRNLETKLRMTPAFCHGFALKVIPTGKEMKRFKDIITLRNELVHANLNTSMIGHEKGLDGYIFVDTPKGIRAHYETANSPTLLSKSTLTTMFETVENVVELVLQAMDIRYRHELEKVLHRERFAAHLVNGEYVVEVVE